MRMLTTRKPTSSRDDCGMNELNFAELGFLWVLEQGVYDVKAEKVLDRPPSQHPDDSSGLLISHSGVFATTPSTIVNST